MNKFSLGKFDRVLKKKFFCRKMVTIQCLPPCKLGKKILGLCTCMNSAYEGFLLMAKG